MLEVRELSKSFDGIQAVSKLVFSVEEGEILGIVGPNGSGKTTILDLITGLHIPDKGEIELNGTLIQGFLPFKIASRGVMRTFQHPKVFNQLNLLENILLSVRDKHENLWGALSLKWKRNEKDKRRKAEQILEDIGLAKEKQDKKAFELSYGQMKRLELGRALMNKKAKLFLFDEPTSGLDPEIIKNIVQIISQLKEKKKAIIVVEHNMDVVRDMADRIIVLNHGQKIAEGSPRDVLENPLILEVFLGR